ncbi:MAG: hypothetical protein LUE86_14025 [Clostridiales bacterium]|nr:hypothetical protein [Clostridiales bacterium]
MKSVTRNVTNGSFFRIMMEAMKSYALPSESLAFRMESRGEDFAVYKVTESFPGGFGRISEFTVLAAPDVIRVVGETGIDYLEEAAIRQGIGNDRMQRRVRAMVKMEKGVAA